MPEVRQVDKKPIMVLAIGGNALIPDNEHVDMTSQREVAAKLAVDLVDLIETGWRIVLTHGNGPHVGIHLLQDEAARQELPQYPLDHYVSSTQGEIGYLLQLAIYNELMQRRARHQVVALTTQVVVNPTDSAFNHPDKPIGVFMSEEEAKRRAQELSWNVVEDAGRGWRRVVPSPKPEVIIELEMIKALIDHDVLVIACGGGGIPVVVNDQKHLVGIEAVIDKDRVSALLGHQCKRMSI